MHKTPINREDYLRANSGFINYLVKVIKGKENINHAYLDGAMSFDTLEDACNNYLFPMKSTEARNLKINAELEKKKEKNGLKANETKLSTIRKTLDDSKKSGDQGKFFQALKLALFWGATGKIKLDESTKRKGTYSANKAWIENELLGKTDLILHFDSACNILSSDNPDTSKFGIDGPYRMNAGFTKLYSLLTDNFIIYDGRVGAALGFLVAKYCSSNSECFSDHLRFAWGPAESTSTKGRAPYRDPSVKDKRLVFQKLSNSKGDDWTKWNIHANWLLEAAMDKVCWKFNGEHGQSALRRVEAALFMIGYDFPDMDPQIDGNRGEKEKTSSTRRPAARRDLVVDREMRATAEECQRMREGKSGVSKKQAALHALHALPGRSKQQFIWVFVEGCGLTQHGASTYYYKLKSG